MNRPRISTSSLLPKILDKMYNKAKCVNMTKKLVIQYGVIIPFRVLPKRAFYKEEIFILLREDGYIPNHELKLLVK